MKRRDILKMGAMGLLPAADAKPVRVGLVGVGNRGTVHVGIFLKMKGVQIPAVCDINEERVTRAQDMVEKAGQPKPEGYSRGETDFRRLCDRNDLNVVLIATPWEWHAPAALYAMRAGKHAAVEVPVAITVIDHLKSYFFELSPEQSNIIRAEGAIIRLSSVACVGA